MQAVQMMKINVRLSQLSFTVVGARGWVRLIPTPLSVYTFHTAVNTRLYYRHKRVCITTVIELISMDH